MRQVTDMLVWLAVISIFAAVVYFTPRVADYVSARDAEMARGTKNAPVVVYQPADSPNATP